MTPDTRRNLGRAWAALPKRPDEAKRVLSLLASLGDLGWQDSVARRAPVDHAGGPVPWYTYPALLWLTPRLRPGDMVFEYGGGNSTRFYASHVAAVVTVEHDDRWASDLAASAPANATILHRRCTGDAVRAPEGDPYVGAFAERRELFDVVVVDGSARVSCVERVAPRLQPATLLLLDNADRPQYRQALERLAHDGFRRIDFVGPVPGSGRLSCTTVFARDLGRWLEAHPPLDHYGY